MSGQVEQLSKRGKHACSIICPDVDFLNKSEILTDVVCPVPNCDDVFSHTSALDLHLFKVHRLDQKREINDLLVTRPMSKEQKITENCNCTYHCPVEKCKYNVCSGEKRSLPSFHSLKNHYIRIHGNKKFKCVKCVKSFSIKSEMERHELNCGKLYSCSECNINYSTYQALLKHVKKKNHNLASIEELKPQQPPTTSQLYKNRNESKNPETRAAIKRSSPHVFILPDLTRSAYNHSVSTNTCGVNFVAPILILPVNTSSGQLLSNKDSHSLSQVMNSDNNNPFSDYHRSFGCQANDQNDLIVTQEAGSQTVMLNASQYQQTSQSTTVSGMLNMDSFKVYEQQTTTHMPQHHEQIDDNQSNAETNDDYFYLDAATSTSPLLNLETLLNDISTQTNQQRVTNSNTTAISFDMLASAAVAVANTATGPLSTMPASMSTSTYDDINLLNSSMNSNASTGSGPNHNNRCTTPSAANVHTFAACQTEDFYFDSSFNATHNSTQTTRFFANNVVETQTEWNEFL